MSTLNNQALSVPLGSLEAYRHSVFNYPMLTAEEEHDLAERYHRDNDLDAAWSLVLSHLRFVVRVARGYRGYGLPEADLIQEGNIGLMKAVKRFDPEVGVRLVSFAVHWVKAEIHEYVLRNWRIVKVATTKAQRKLFFNLRSANKRLSWLDQEEINAVAEDLGVSAHSVVEMEKRLAAFDPSFDNHPVVDGDSVKPSPAGYLEDLRFEPAAQLEEAQWAEHNDKRLYSALAQLDERSQTIVRRRWLADKKSTLHELAACYGVSAERIRQLEQAAMKKLRANMND